MILSSWKVDDVSSLLTLHTSIIWFDRIEGGRISLSYQLREQAS